MRLRERSLRQPTGASLSGGSSRSIDVHVSDLAHPPLEKVASIIASAITPPKVVRGRGAPRTSNGGIVGENDSAASAIADAERVARLSAVSRSIRRELLALNDEQAIFARGCDAAVELGRFRFAWLGVVDRASGTVKPAAQSGEGSGYTDAVTVTLGHDPRAQGPTGSALRELLPIVCSDIATDPRMKPFRDAALARGFRSSGAFPISRCGEPYGSLNVYAVEPGFVDLLVQYALEGLAEDIGVALDAIDRQRERTDAQAHQGASETRYRAIFEHATDGIFVAAADHRYVDVNPAGAAMLGYTRDELLTMSISDVLDAEALATRPIGLELAAPNVSFFSERRLCRKDGTVFDAEIHGVKLADGSLESVVRDVSERKRVHATLAATERMASLGRLAHGVGHEINNPLAYLTMNLELVRTKVRAAPTDLREALEAALASAEDGAARIAHVVRSLASFGRGDADTVRSVQLSRVVQDARMLTANRLKHMAAIEVDVDSAPPVLANEFHLVQVFVNLLLNAADAMETVTNDRHLVRITASAAADEHVTVDVVDTGTGIPRHERARIFDPFFTTKAVGRGTGIGLSISQAILAKFGGTIAIDEERDAGSGALFRVTLKRASGAPVAVASVSPARASRRLRLLIIDDEPLIRRIVARALPEHEVVTLDTVPAAIELCLREDFDAVLCDLMLPGMTGEAFFSALEKSKPELARRVVFMTGGAFTGSAQAFLDRVPDRCLAKPFSVKQLLEALLAAADR